MGLPESAPGEAERRAKAPLEPNFSRFGALSFPQKTFHFPHPMHRRNFPTHPGTAAAIAPLISSIPFAR